MDNQTLGIIAAVVVIAGSVLYLNMGSGASSAKPSGKDSKDGKSGKEEKKEKVAIRWSNVLNLVAFTLMRSIAL